MSETPLLSVFIPAYNAEKFVREAVESALDNGFRDMEVVVLDDGSTDATVAIVESIRHPALRIERNPANIGFGPMRRRGMSLLRGRYAANLDADDIALPGRFEAQLQRMEQADGPDILGGADEMFGDVEATRVFPADDGAIKAFLLFNSPFGNSTTCIRLAPMRAGRIAYPVSAEPAEDYALWVEAMIAGLRMENLPVVLIRYRRHGDAMTVKWGRRVTAQARVVRQRVIEHYFPQMLEVERAALLDGLSGMINGGQRWLDAVYALAHAAQLAATVPHIDPVKMRSFMVEYLMLMLNHGKNIGVISNDTLEMMTDENEYFEHWRRADGGALDREIMAGFGAGS
jgi:glycosyltransferase involved in cell wall biosynthesis